MAEKVVVDTSVVVRVLEEGDEELLLELARRDAYISYVTLYEYLWGYRYLGRDYLAEKEAVEKLFHVVYPTQEVLLKAMEIDVDLTKRGTRVPQADIIIAATAIVLQAPLLTTDLKHFPRMERYGLRVITRL